MSRDFRGRSWGRHQQRASELRGLGTGCSEPPGAFRGLWGCLTPKKDVGCDGGAAGNGMEGVMSRSRAARGGEETDGEKAGGTAGIFGVLFRSGAQSGSLQFWGFRKDLGMVA